MARRTLKGRPRDRLGRLMPMGGRSTGRRQRRHNPGEELVPVLLANPRAQARRAAPAGRGRSRVVVVNEPAARRRRRRSNPILGGVGQMVGLAIAGTGGILIARMVRYWIRKLGDSIAVKIGSVVGGAAAAWGAGKLLGAAQLSGPFAGAVLVGGIGESLRGGIGLLVEQVAPGFERDKAGLGAAAGDRALAARGQPRAPQVAQPYAVDDAGVVYQLDGRGEYVAVGQVQAVAAEPQLAQLGDIVPEDQFGAMVEEGVFG